MTKLQDYVKTQSVFSKLSESVIVGQWEHLQLVFIHGYPMTLRGFYVMTSKAIFGSKIPYSTKIWNELHAETKILCNGLGHKLKEGREAQSVIEGIRIAANWTKETAQRQWPAPLPIHAWLESVERQLAAQQGLILPELPLR
jgi:hypothetical protein